MSKDPVLFFFETKSSVSILFSLSRCSHSPVGGTHTYSSAPSRLRHTRASMRISRTRNGGSECVCAIACLYLLWKRERRRRRTELLGVILYNYIILYTIIYRAPGVANSNNHFLLHAAVHPGLHCTEFDG